MHYYTACSVVAAHLHIYYSINFTVHKYQEYFTVTECRCQDLPFQESSEVCKILCLKRNIHSWCLP